MMKKLYFVQTNAYDMIISDDGEMRRVLIDNDACNIYDWRERAEEYLREKVEDDSSWAEYAETVDEILYGGDSAADADRPVILAEIEKNI